LETPRVKKLYILKKFKINNEKSKEHQLEQAINILNGSNLSIKQKNNGKLEYSE